MNKMNGESMDIVADKIQKMKELFPDAFLEGKIDFDHFKSLLGEYIDESNEKYSFSWRGKSKAVKAAQSTSTATLRPSKDKSVSWNDTNNIYIEGDNLEVLKLLQKTYHNKVDMIYIDPPYNTGKDFVYRDNFSQPMKSYLAMTGQIDDDGYKISTNNDSSGRYHTNWLNMIYPRLRIARNLMSDSGVIFISIDNNEIHNLRKICDEIFGEDQFVECVTWNKRIPKNDKGIGNIHEYILIYTKNSQMRHEFVMRKDGIDEINKLIQDLKKKNTPLEEAERIVKELYKKNGYDRGITLYNSLDKDYRLWGKINMSWPNGNTTGPRYEVLHPITKKPVKIPDRGWRWKRETFESVVDYENIEICTDGTYLCGGIWFGKDENMQPSSVKHLEDLEEMLFRSVVSLKSDGGIEVEKIFGSKNYFSYPKPTKLIKQLLYSIGKKDAIVLDFFSGSASTAQAVLEMNIEDSGNRRFIMVQLPEKVEIDSEPYKAGYLTLCDIGRERIKRFGSEMKCNSSINENNHDLGYKVFELNTSNIKEWNPDIDNIEITLESTVNNFVEGRTHEDILYEIMLKYGIDLTYPVEEYDVNGSKVFSVGFGALLVCLEDNINVEIANGMVNLIQEQSPEVTRVVFKDNGFKSDSVKTNVMQTLKRHNIDEVVSI